MRFLQDRLEERRRRLAGRIAGMLDGIEFTLSSHTVLHDEEVILSIDISRNPRDGTDVLVIVNTGSPPGPDVRDLPLTLGHVASPAGTAFRLGRTDRRGQLRFRDVAPGTYRLVLAGGLAHAGGSLASCARVAAAGEDIERGLEFHAPDGSVVVRVRFPHGRFLAEVEVDAARLQDRRLARLVLTDRGGNLAALGWVGLYDEEGRPRPFGQLDLDRLQPGLREKLAELSVEVDALSPQESGDGAGLDPAGVVEALDRSIDATDHAVSRRVLVHALSLIGEPGAVACLVRRLEDRAGPSDLRQECARTLSASDDSDARDALRRRLSDRDEDLDIQQACEEALAVAEGNVSIPFARSVVGSEFLALAAGDEEPSQAFHSADGRVQAWLRESSGQLLLEVEISQELVPDRLARFELSDAQGRLASGFLGLLDDPSRGTAFGDLLLELFDPDFRRHGPGLSVEVRPQPIGELVAADRAGLERSLEAMKNPRFGIVLEAALKHLGEGTGGTGGVTV